MKRQTPERCSFRFRRVRAAYVCTCSLSLSLLSLSLSLSLLCTDLRRHTHVYTTPMMKTKRAFLRNSIRGARTLVFSPPDSSGLPGREQLQAFLCFLGCLRRIVYVYVCAYASRLYFAAHQFLILFFSIVVVCTAFVAAVAVKVVECWLSPLSTHRLDELM